MKLRSAHLAVLVLVAVFGTILVTSLTGAWVTTTTRIPGQISEGEFAGASDPADIRGSYSFDDVQAAFGVPVPVLAQAFGVPEAGAGAYAAKDLEEAYGDVGGMEIGTDSLRLFVALYTGVPYTPEETTGLPESAWEILRSRDGAVSPEAAEISGTVAPAPEAAGDLAASDVAAGDVAASDVAASETHAEPTDGVVKGGTTFADVLSWGLTREQVESVIGGPMPARGTTIRDHATAQGVAFGEYRTAFQALLDGVE